MESGYALLFQGGQPLTSAAARVLRDEVQWEMARGVQVTERNINESCWHLALNLVGAYWAFRDTLDADLNSTHDLPPEGSNAGTHAVDPHEVAMRGIA